MANTFTPAAARKADQHFAVAEAPYDYTFSPGAGLLRLHKHRSDLGGGWWDGDFVDYRGIVSIQREATYLRLDAVANGRCHVRTWQRYYGDRTVARLCRAFLSDLHGTP